MTLTSTDEPRSRRWTLAALVGSLAAFLPWRSVTATAQGAPAPLSGPHPLATRSQRGRWEYALYDLQTYKATRYNAFFNQLGAQGWELVGLAPYTPVGATDGEHVLVTFKRAR